MSADLPKRLISWEHVLYHYINRVKLTSIHLSLSLISAPCQTKNTIPLFPDRVVGVDWKKISLYELNLKLPYFFSYKYFLILNNRLKSKKIILNECFAETNSFFIYYEYLCDLISEFVDYCKQLHINFKNIHMKLNEFQ